MKKLCFDYYTRIDYSEPAGRCHYTIRCMPPDTDSQSLLEWKIEIEPSGTREKGEDSFGNRLVFGSVEEKHDSFSFHVTGRVKVGHMPEEKPVKEYLASVYRYPSRLTRPGDKLINYYERMKISESRDPFVRAKEMMDRLYGDFTYETCVTDVSTTAEDAWRIGKGVCQDYAHILIALCRLSGIPARYVAGMMIGEGSSHGWVEVFSQGQWRGLDPTNDICVQDAHIKLGTGRDAWDCPINRGVVTGGGRQTQTIQVRVWEEQAAKGSQNERV